MKHTQNQSKPESFLPTTQLATIIKMLIGTYRQAILVIFNFSSNWKGLVSVVP